MPGDKQPGAEMKSLSVALDDDSISINSNDSPYSDLIKKVPLNG